MVSEDFDFLTTEHMTKQTPTGHGSSFSKVLLLMLFGVPLKISLTQFETLLVDFEFSFYEFHFGIYV